MTEQPGVPFVPHAVEWTDEQVTRFWDFYSTHASSEEYFSRKNAGSILAAMRRHASPVGRLLDVGCGSGHFIGELVARGVDAWGVDSSPESIEAARRRVGPQRAQVASFAAIPVPDASFDTLTYIEVVEHVLDDGLDLLFAEALRVLKPGGRIVITTPNDEELADSVVQCPDCGAQFHRMQHVRSWTAEGLTATVRAAGFASAVAYPGRFIEAGPSHVRLAKRAIQAVRRSRPHLLVVGRKA